MRIIFNRQYYLFILSIFYYLSLFTIADNNTDYHSNETIVEFDSTIVSVTTIANVTNENTSIEVDEVTSSSEILTNSTVFVTSTPLETTTQVHLTESDTTFHEDNDVTTVLTQINETQVYTEKIEEQTTVVSNTSCEVSKYGCCSDGVTEKTGKSLPNKENLSVKIFIS